MNLKPILCLALVLSGNFFATSIVAQNNQVHIGFTGAEGFGRFASGGRGGEIFHVTTLDDSGAGSFRDAVSQPNRVVVFDVGGIIRLKSNVAVSSDISLLGQTAPGDGIMLYGRSVSFSGQRNVIVRYLRFREGIAGDRGKCSVNLSGGSNMIFDHCSIEWGRWDCLGLTQGSHDITFQNCIIGEGIDPQRFGSLSDSVTNITYSHNLWINNQSRNSEGEGPHPICQQCGLQLGQSADSSADILGSGSFSGCHRKLFYRRAEFQFSFRRRIHRY